MTQILPSNTARQ